MSYGYLSPSVDIASAVPLIANGPALRYDRPYRFTPEEYDRLVHSGFFPTDARLELLEGIITMMTPMGEPHAAVTHHFGDVILALLPKGWTRRTQLPIVTIDSRPQPDCCVFRGAAMDYTSRHPGAADIAIVMEIADSSVLSDRRNKQRIYAAAGIPEYWIVNLPCRKVEVYRKPTPAEGERPATYELVESYDSDKPLPVVLDGDEIGTLAVRDILP